MPDISTLLGAAGLKIDGPHNPAKEYKKYYVVTKNGCSYVYINENPSAGNSLYDTTYWLCMAEGIKADGPYDPDKEYSKGMLVSSNGGSYLYVNDLPSSVSVLTDTSHWQQIASQGDTGPSAYQAAVSAGYTGTEAEFNAAMGDLPNATQAANEAAEAAATNETITNLVNNPYPENDLRGWSHYSNYSTESLESGWMRSTKDNTKPYPYQKGDWGIPAGNVLYVSLEARSNKATTLTMNLTKESAVSAAVSVSYLPLTTDGKRFVFILTPSDVVNYLTFNAGSLTTNGDYIEIRNVVMINLTKEFGEGNERRVLVDDFLKTHHSDTFCFEGTVPFLAIKPTLSALHVTHNFWSGKRIWWCGTSIPASKYESGLAYPQIVAESLGATVYNESASGTGIHVRQIPPEWNGGFPAGMYDLSQTRAEKQIIIDDWANQYIKFNGAPSTLTELQKTAILDSSYETKLGKYLSGGEIGPCDLYVFDHGYNDGTGAHPIPEDPYDRTTFIGAMNYLIREILNDNPRARVIIIGHYENNQYPSIVTAQQHVANYWKIPICPLWDKLGWTQVTLSTSGYWAGTDPNYIWVPSGGDVQTLTMKQIALPDNLHPHKDSSGHAINLIAGTIISWMVGIR